MKPSSHFWTLIDPKTNKARWYSLTTSTDLFGDTVLVKRWGRIGRTGQQHLDWFVDMEAVQQEILKANARRLRHGYGASCHPDTKRTSL